MSCHQGHEPRYRRDAEVADVTPKGVKERNCGKILAAKFFGRNTDIKAMYRRKGVKNQNSQSYDPVNILLIIMINLSKNTCKFH